MKLLKPSLLIIFTLTMLFSCGKKEKPTTKPNTDISSQKKKGSQETKQQTMSFTNNDITDLVVAYNKYKSTQQTRVYYNNVFLNKTTYQNMHLHCCEGEEFSIQGLIESDQNNILKSITFITENKTNKKKFLKIDGIKYLKKSNGMIEIQVVLTKKVNTNNKIKLKFPDNLKLNVGDKIDLHVYLEEANRANEFGKNNNCYTRCNAFRFSLIMQELINSDFNKNKSGFQENKVWKNLMKNESFKNLKEEDQTIMIDGLLEPSSHTWVKYHYCSSLIGG